MRSVLLLKAIGLAALLTACKRPLPQPPIADGGDPRDASPSASAPAPASASASGSPASASAAAGGDAGATLPPLSGIWTETLTLEGGGEAHVVLPLGATSPRPIVVGVHGAGDRPDWSCSEWLAVTGGTSWVVCPHGSHDARWKGTLVWGSAAAIAKETARAVASLKARYGKYVAEGPMLYGAWSQGATLAGGAVEASGNSFDRVVLVEIGHTAVDARAMARSFKKAGVRRVVVSCSSMGCRTFAADFRNASRAVDLPLHVTDVGLRGHWFDEPVVRVLAAEQPWLDESDAP